MPGWIRRLLAALAGRPRPPAPPPPDRPPNLPPGDGVSAHNQARADHGLPPLVGNDALTTAAAAQAKECARVGRVTHTGANGSDPWQRIAAAGYHGGHTSENGYGATWPATAADAVAAWMQSNVGHKDNVLGDYRHVGMAHADAADGDRFWVATYGSP